MAPHDSVSTAHSLPEQDLPTPDALLEIAEAYFGEGLVGLAGQLATLAARHGAPDDMTATVQRRVEDARAADAAAERLTPRDDEFLIPAIERTTDGAPAFFLPIPAEAAGQAEVIQVIAQEVQGDGVDAELRSFLGAMIEPGDTYVDCDPGFGLALLTAATRHPGSVRVVSRAADHDHATFLRRAFEINALREVSIAPPVGDQPQSLDALLKMPMAAQGDRVIIHAGQADDVAAMTSELTNAVRHPRVTAVVWSIGSDEANAQVSATLAGLGTQHFVIANDADGAVLVPRDAVDGATIIISLTSSALGDRQAA